jgi:hypothetical protein
MTVAVLMPGSLRSVLNSKNEKGAPGTDCYYNQGIVTSSKTTAFSIYLFSVVISAEDRNLAHRWTTVFFFFNILKV